jgi:predicted RNase H-like HicB family nuclease
MSTRTENSKYTLIVEWSDEDQIYIGRCPDLFWGGVHGKERKAVFEELCQAVDEVIADAEESGVPLRAAKDVARLGLKI